MSRSEESIRQEVERLRESLRTCVEESGLPRAAVARDAGLSEEELGQILCREGVPWRPSRSSSS